MSQCCRPGVWIAAAKIVCAVVVFILRFGLNSRPNFNEKEA